MYSMTTNEAAKKSSLSVKGIQSAIHSGKLPAVKIGRDWWIEPVDFERWMNEPRKVGRPRKKQG